MIAILILATTSMYVSKLYSDDQENPLILDLGNRRAWEYKVYERDIIRAYHLPDNRDVTDNWLLSEKRIYRGTFTMTFIDTLARELVNIIAEDNTRWNIISPVWSVKWFHDLEAYLFETHEGLFWAPGLYRETSHKLISFPMNVGEEWIFGTDTKMKICAITDTTINNASYKLFEAHEFPLQYPSIYKWAVGIGLIYYAHWRGDVPYDKVIEYELIIPQ